MNELDIKRNFRFSFWSGMYCGCVQHYIYNVFYSRLFRIDRLYTRIGKTMLDNCVTTPFFAMPIYFISKSLMLNNGIINGFNEYKNDVLSIMKTYWKIWFPGIFIAMCAAVCTVSI